MKVTHILKSILHLNCIWDVNNSIMCVHQIWLDAVLKHFVKYSGTISGKHFIKGYLLSSEADMSCLNYSIKNTKTANMCGSVQYV